MKLPVPLLVLSDVGGYNLGRSSALEFEREESVRGPHIEAALTAHVRPRQLIDDRPQVEHPRRQEPRDDLDRVIPPRYGGDRSLSIGSSHVAVWNRGHQWARP